MQYAIVAFPVFDAAAAIESVRCRFDPLASMLPAHVTLVFPFTDVVGEADLAKHVARTLEDHPVFDIALSDVTVEDGGYVLLNVETGANVLSTLHDRLYGGLLASHLSSAHEYRPHVTIGRLPDDEQARSAAAQAILHLVLPLLGKINDVALFRLSEDGSGDVALTIGLKPDSARPASDVQSSSPVKT